MDWNSEYRSTLPGPATGIPRKPVEIVTAVNSGSGHSGRQGSPTRSSTNNGESRRIKRTPDTEETMIRIIYCSYLKCIRRSFQCERYWYEAVSIAG